MISFLSYWLRGLNYKLHPALIKQPVLFASIARLAGWPNIGQSMIAAFSKWHHMILLKPVGLRPAISTAVSILFFQPMPLSGFISPHLLHRFSATLPMSDLLSG